jgi:hypothetical protein
MEPAAPLRRIALHMGQQKIAKEIMVSIRGLIAKCRPPGADYFRRSVVGPFGSAQGRRRWWVVVVKGDQEEVAVIEIIQDRSRIRAAHDRRAGCGCQLGQDGRLQQEHAHKWLLPVQHLVGQKWLHILSV